MNSIELLGRSIEWIPFLPVFYGIVVFILHVIMAIAVNTDARRLEYARVGVFMFVPLLWGWIVFIFGIAGLALYWTIHHSTLKPSASANTQ
jgi:hypothetical protein